MREIRLTDAELARPLSEEEIAQRMGWGHMPTWWIPRRESDPMLDLVAEGVWG